MANTSTFESQLVCYLFFIKLCRFCLLYYRVLCTFETLLNEAALEQLKTIGEEVVVYHDFPTEEEEVIRRIGNADCLLVSFRTPIRRRVLDACRATITCWVSQSLH